jgi:hypothetical protein
MKTSHQKRNTIMFRTIFFLLFASLAFILNSCYPGDTLTAADTDVIATFFSKNADFSTKMTFAMPDSIVRIDEDGNPISDPGPYDQQILNKIEQNLQQMGYTEEQDPANADVLVVTFVTTTTWVSGGCYNWWYGWWYPYPGWCYPVAYTYQTGSILITMTDPQNQTSTEGLWIAGINGILEDNSAGISARINNNIDQAFKQSPYLAEGK